MSQASTLAELAVALLSVGAAKLSPEQAIVKHPYDGTYPAFGYWRSSPAVLASTRRMVAEGDSGASERLKIKEALPDPANLVDESWDLAERTKVAAALDAGKTVQGYRGCSYCRLCDKDMNGSQCLTDGVDESLRMVDSPS